MSFEKWTDQKFGSNFMQEETLTYFRMSAAFDAGQEEMKQQRDELLAAAIEVLSFVEGALPTLGYLSDNDKSRAALEKLRIEIAKAEA